MTSKKGKWVLQFVVDDIIDTTSSLVVFSQAKAIVVHGMDLAVSQQYLELHNSSLSYRCVFHLGA